MYKTYKVKFTIDDSDVVHQSIVSLPPGRGIGDIAGRIAWRQWGYSRMADRIDIVHLKKIDA